MSRDEVAAAIEDLADAIRELGETIEGRPRSNEGTPRPTLLSPPSVTDVLRAADERAIPALVTLLEAQIRTLRYLQRGSRFVRKGKAVDDRLRGPGSPVPDRHADPEVVLDRLGSTLDQIGRRLEGSADQETRDLFERTRSLYADIDDRLAEYERGLDDEASSTGEQEGYRIDISDRSSDADEAEAASSATDIGNRRGPSHRDDDGVDVDVDAELETLRERYGRGDEEPPAEDGEGARSEGGADDGSDDPPRESDAVDRPANASEDAGDDENVDATADAADVAADESGLPADDDVGASDDDVRADDGTSDGGDGTDDDET